MKNIKLNPGGLIGAIACGAIAALILYAIISAGTPPEKLPLKLLFLGPVIGGAFAGNFLWDFVFKKPEWPAFIGDNRAIYHEEEFWHRKTTGIVMTVIGGLMTLSGLNLAVTKYNLSSSHDLSVFLGGLGFSLLILAGGVAILLNSRNKGGR